MRLFVTGATGLIGARLVEDRLRRGDEVLALTRDAARATSRFEGIDTAKLRIIEGDPARAGGWQREVSSCDGVVNLAGAGIADKRWSEAYKRVMRDSRIEGARRIIEAIRDAATPPEVLLNASAVGYYGERGDVPVAEDAPASDDFLGGLCVAWEAAADGATELGVRVVKTRFGVVLDSRGGALPKMAVPFGLFVGGPIGNGRAYVPWVHWEDVVGAIGFMLEQPSIKGPINVTSPEPVRNADFSRALGEAIGRPSWLPVPRVAVRLLMGEVAKYALASTRAIPGRLQQYGYTFRHPKVHAAMQSLFGGQ